LPDSFHPAHAPKGRTDGSRHRRTPEVAVAEDLRLRLLRPPRGDLERVRGGQGDAAARGDVATGQLLDIGRLLAQQGPRRDSTVDHFLWREIGLRR
jgi:hypothetical protein